MPMRTGRRHYSVLTIECMYSAVKLKFLPGRSATFNTYTAGLDTLLVWNFANRYSPQQQPFIGEERHG